MSISISGTVYTDEGVTPMGSGRTLNVSVNGAASSGSTTTASDGTYTISGITAASGAVLTVYLQGNAEVGCTVTKSTGSNLTGVNLYQNHLNIRSDNGAALTGTNFNTADNNGATGISAIFTASSNTALTMAAGKHLLIMSGQTYAPGGNSVIGVNGNWVNRGTFTAGSSQVRLLGAAGGTVTSGGSSFSTIRTLTPAATYTLMDNLQATNQVLLGSGVLDVSASNYTITTGFFFAVTSGSSSPFNPRNGTVIIGSGGLAPNYGAGTVSFWNVNVQDGVASSVDANCTVTNNFSIGTGSSFDLAGTTLTVGGNWSSSGTLTDSVGGSGVTLSGINQSITGSTTFNNLTVSRAAADTLTFTAGTTQTITGTLTLNGAAGQLLSLRSSATPSSWTVNATSTVALSYLDVKDSVATTALNAGTGSVDSHNNTNWTFPGASGGTPVLRSGILSSRIIQPGFGGLAP